LYWDALGMRIDTTAILQGSRRYMDKMGAVVVYDYRRDK
jgi:hypothetical protein